MQSLEYVVLKRILLSSPELSRKREFVVAGEFRPEKQSFVVVGILYPEKEGFVGARELCSGWPDI